MDDAIYFECDSLQFQLLKADKLSCVFILLTADQIVDQMFAKDVFMIETT